MTGHTDLTIVAVVYVLGFGLGNVYWTFDLLVEICLFETLEMLYCGGVGWCWMKLDGPPKGSFFFLFCDIIKIKLIYTFIFKKIAYKFLLGLKVWKFVFFIY